MKRLIGMPILLLFAGCGPDLTLPGALGPMDNQEILKSITSECESSYKTPLKIAENTSFSAQLVLVASLNGQVQDKKLSQNPSLKERCLEVENSLSQAPVDLKFEIHFSGTSEQREQMRNGKAAKIRPDSAKLEFTDGSLNNAYTDLKLRCPDAATVACRFSDDEEKRCESHDITYVGKCIFTSEMLFYTFSDLKKTMLDLEGEIEFFGANGAEARFSSVSWKQVY